MLSADGLPTHLVVTRSGIRTCLRSTVPCRYGFTAQATLSYHRNNQIPIRDCGTTLESPSFSARDGSTRKLLRTFEMVAASKPTSGLSPRSHFLCHLASTWGPWSAVWVLSLWSTKLLPRALTAGVRHRGIRSWVSVGRREAPQPNSVALPPRGMVRRWP